MTVMLENISKTFGEHVALQNVSLTMQEGTLTSLLGPSGCGKTTLLRIISGLEHPSEGRVLVDGRDVTYGKEKRNIGFVFQHYALFQHMNVFDNVAFGLTVKPKKQRLSHTDIQERVHEVLSLVQLDNQSRKFPHQLSGGQQQRIALARVLAIQPKILLLDEPFGALDSIVRRDLRRWLRRLHDEIHVTTILVTHDQEEALEISDTVALFNHGILEQSGHPRDIYRAPASAFVYEFLGAVNVFQGRFKDSNLVHFTVDKEEAPIAESAQSFYVRPHEIQVRPLAEKQEQDLCGIIIRVRFVANTVFLEIRMRVDCMAEDEHEQIVEASITDDSWEIHRFKTGDKVAVCIKNVAAF